MLAKYGCLSNKMVNLFYQWTPSEEVPALPTERDGKGWRGFQSRDTLRLTVDDTQTMDNTWYVHIYAEDGEGEKLFTVHSGAFLLEGESRDGDYLYKIKSYTDGHEYAVITKYIGNETELAIPDTLGGKTVKEIGKEAFNQKGLTRVEIPDGVTSIGDSAFAFNKLTSVTIPDSVMGLGNWAFHTNRLKSVTIGNSVTVIWSSAFDSNQLESVIIPDSVTVIEDGAFRYNILKSVQIGNSVERIGSQAFAFNQLTSVTLPDSLSIIEFRAFYKNQLQKVTIPDHVTSIENSAFEDNQLISVQIGHSVESIGASAFAFNRLTSIRIPNNVTFFGPNLFWNNPLKVVIGELDSAAQTYAGNNNIIFLNFDPWSSDGQVQKEAQTTVTAIWNKGFSLQYQWTTSEEEPVLPTEPEGNEWTMFESGDLLRHSLDDAKTIDSTWYVHIYAQDEDGRNLFVVHSGAFLLEVPEQVAKPVAHPAGGEVPPGTKVSLSTETEDATIHYTLDGSTPSSSSTPYTEPIEVASAITLKAIAVKDGMLDSEVMEEHYTIATQLPPTNLTASAGDRSVTLKWDAVTGTGSVTYAVYQAEGSSAPVDPANWKLVQSNVTANAYIVTGLTNGQSYTFAVKAISADGASDFSNVATATPRATGGNGGSGDGSGGGSGGGGAGRVLSGNANLADLQIWAGGKPLKLSPSFASSTTEYTARTEAERVELVVKEAHSAAKVILNDKVISGKIKVDLKEGGNSFVLTVQAEDGTKKKYTLTIYRETPKPTQPVIDFTDIAGHWAESYIKRAAARGIVSGYPDGTFKPNNPVTRAEFTVMLAGALKLKGEGATNTFTDNDQIGGWAKQAIVQAAQASIVGGYADGSFRPNAPITRAEMAAMIARALKLQLNAHTTTGFADDDTIPGWAKGAVEAIRELGLIAGRGGNRFAPNETATRAEATVMLLRMLEHSH